MTRFMRMMGGLALAALMTACGGGGGSPGTTTAGGTTTPGGLTTPGGTTTTVVTPASAVADFALFTDKTTMNNSGTDKAQLTVVAVDANRNIVSGAAVSVAADQNSVFTPSSGSVTDSSGTFLGTVSTGADKTDRDITLSVTINGSTKRTAVRVAGSKLTLQAVPPLPAPGQNVVLSATVLDSSGNPIPNVTVKLGGTIPALLNASIVTNLSGSATKSFVAPGTAGIYTLTASGNGVNAADYQLQVFSSAIPVAVIPPGAAPSLSASPNVLAINAPGSSSNKSTLRFLFLDAANQPVQNVRVRFSDVTTGLAAVGSSISSGTTTLFTDASGSVTAEYISGQNSSPTNGVTVKACYSASDFASGACPSSITASLTVAGQALAVSVGDDNLLEKGPGTYIKRFAVTVADAAGRAVVGAPVDISVDLTHYSKGEFSSPFFDAGGADAGGGPLLEDRLGLTVVPPNVPAQAYPSDPLADLSGLNSPRYSVDPTSERVWCSNEDLNRNVNVDPLENLDGSLDANGAPTLEPRKSDLIISYGDPAITTTNASGILVIKVEYSQRFATWLAYKVRVTANVAGSQGMAERLFVTDYVQNDESNGSFRQPPYGIHACQIVN